jgi:hypothetical protein
MVMRGGNGMDVHVMWANARIKLDGSRAMYKMYLCGAPGSPQATKRVSVKQLCILVGVPEANAWEEHLLLAQDITANGLNFVANTSLKAVRLQVICVNRPTIVVVIVPLSAQFLPRQSRAQIWAALRPPLEPTHGMRAPAFNTDKQLVREAQEPDA